MYEAGNILYFDPFYFSDGTSPKRKYFLVLKVVDNNAILASLPSSKIHLPNFVTIEHGCIDIPESCIGCYIFQQDKPITKCGWSFELNTFLYGNWLNDYKIDSLNATYQIEGLDYEIIGQLTDDELSSVTNCFRKSNVVKMKYKRILSK